MSSGRRARARPAGPRESAGAPSSPRVGAGSFGIVLAGFLGAALLVYEPALSGEFVSDDHHYVNHNPYVHEASVDHVVEILDPAGDAAIAVVNYTPVHLLGHMLAWQAFGSDVRGHHVVNVVLHALASALLGLLFLRTGIPPFASLFGASFFLLHPANVEAVAWISQLKSSSALVLTLAALLAQPRRPPLAAAFFLLALFAKPTAAVALPVAVLLEWTRRGRVRWRWFAAWGLALVAYASAEFATHQRSGAAEATLYETPLTLVRTVFGLAMRYLVMTATGRGVSAFHEPEPAHSWLDPWWLASLPALALLGWRVGVTLRGRRPELAYWAFAVVSFGPVSQIFPFLYPLADRYLYFIMPGLIGGALLAAQDLPPLLARVSPRIDAARAARWLASAGVASGTAFALLFAFQSHGRARVWRSPATLVADAARHYPDGVSAHLLRAKRAAQIGDVESAAASIREAHERGYNRFEQLLMDPGYAGVRDAPAFRRVVEEIAAGWTALAHEREDATQMELRKYATAHLVRREYAEAERLLRRALEVGGPLDATIREDLAAIGQRAR